MNRIKKTVVIALVFAGYGALGAAVERTITPVDANGNPTGPSRTIDIPDTPDATTVVEPVDANGNAVGGPVQIPDGITSPAAPPEANPQPPDDGMVPVEPEPVPAPENASDADPPA